MNLIDLVTTNILLFCIFNFFVQIFVKFCYVLRRIGLFKTKLLSKLKINSVILIHIEYITKPLILHIRHDHILYPGIDCERSEQKICAFFKYFHVKLSIPEGENGISSGLGC